MYLVISMHHDHDPNGSGGQPIADLPHQLPGLVLSLVFNLEHPAEILTQTV